MQSGKLEKIKADYPFGLSDAEEERARNLHKSSVVFDWLSQDIGGTRIFEELPNDLRREVDGLVTNGGIGPDIFAKVRGTLYEFALQGRSNLIEQFYKESGLTCGTYTVPVLDGNDTSWTRAEAQYRRYAELPWLRLVTKASEIRQAKADGVHALYGHWQPAFPLPRRLEPIDDAYRRGLRSLMMTYNRMDHVGVGCTERVDAGLSMFGVDVVRHCENLGIIVDVSHCGEATTIDTCRVAKRPVNANHTCARALSNVARAKSDDAIRAIAGTGGIIGIVTVPFFLSTERTPSIETFFEHIDHIVSLVGWQHISIGSDWPYQLPAGVMSKVFMPTLVEMGFRPQDNVDVDDKLVGFEDYRELPNITRGMVKRGYSDEQIKGILGENALRIFEEICG
jgi:membrane dipeptidase